MIEKQEDIDFCPVCNGSSEGLHDGSVCRACRGCGYVIDEAEQDRIAQGWAERKWDVWRQLSCPVWRQLSWPVLVKKMG